MGLEDGEILLKLLKKSYLISSKHQVILHQAKNTKNKELKTKLNYKVFFNICKELGLPIHFIILNKDRNDKRIAGCILLLSRCCRSSNVRDIRKLTVSTKFLASIGLRPEEMTISRPQPSLTEMQLRG